LSADAELSDISFASDSSVVFFAAICGGVYHAGRAVHASSTRMRSGWGLQNRRRLAAEVAGEGFAKQRHDSWASDLQSLRVLGRGVERPLWYWFLGFARQRRIGIKIERRGLPEESAVRPT
jgi:hypothetical protein